MTAIWAALGLLVTGPLANSWVGTVDQDVAGWLVAHRTPVLDDWSRLGTMPADTRVKIIATAIIAVVMFVAWRSWREPLLVCLALILEAAVFITVTGIIGRPRPDVAQLDQVSVDTSFPSGHAAAAAAYCAIAIVIFQRTRNRSLRAITVIVAVGVPVVVGVCRMYRGVHYFTDVIAGTTLGVACAVAVYAIVRRCLPQPGSERPFGTRAITEAGSPMMVTMVVVLVAAAAAVIVFVLSTVRALPDPIDPARQERAVFRRLARHPRLRRFLRQRLDRRTAGGLVLTVSLLVTFVVALIVGAVLDMIGDSVGLASLDDGIAHWGVGHADSPRSRSSG